MLFFCITLLIVFLANGHACGRVLFSSVCLLSVCSIRIVAKWYILPENCWKNQIGLPGRDTSLDPVQSPIS